jgi:hypothetical protein
MSGKTKKKGKSLRDYKPTIPQNLMREDIVRQTQSLAQVFEGMGFDEPVQSENELSLYGRIQSQAPQLVYDIINEHELTLSLAQWQVVQVMMEKALLTGVDLVGTAGR